MSTRGPQNGKEEGEQPGTSYQQPQDSQASDDESTGGHEMQANAVIRANAARSGARGERGEETAVGQEFGGEGRTSISRPTQSARSSSANRGEERERSD